MYRSALNQEFNRAILLSELFCSLRINAILHCCLDLSPDERSENDVFT